MRKVDFDLKIIIEPILEEFINKEEPFTTEEIFEEVKLSLPKHDVLITDVSKCVNELMLLVDNYKVHITFIPSNKINIAFF